MSKVFRICMALSLLASVFVAGCAKKDASTNAPGSDAPAPKVGENGAGAPPAPSEEAPMKK